MTRPERSLRFLTTYWPILAVLPVVAVISVVVWLAGDPWSAGDWGSNVVLALAITVATTILSRKQAKLQEDAADLELDEKIAAVSGSIDELLTERTAGRVCRMINDGRAGLNLIGSGHRVARDSYLRNLLGALGVIQGLVDDGLHCHTHWTVDDWRAVNRALSEMLSPLERRRRRERALDDALMARLRQTIALLVERTTPAGDIVPDREPYERSSSTHAGQVAPPAVSVSAFVGQYRERDMRVLLNWARLTGAGSPDEGVEIQRHAVTEMDELALDELYTPWFLDPAGRSVDHDDPDAEPIRFDDIDRRFDGFSDVRKDRVESILRDMDHSSGVRPYRFAIATLAVSDDTRIVLDGNHRLAAVARSATRRGGVVQNVEIVEYRIVTGRVEGLLPDTAWHLRRALAT